MTIRPVCTNSNFMWVSERAIVVAIVVIQSLQMSSISDKDFYAQVIRQHNEYRKQHGNVSFFSICCMQFLRCVQNFFHVYVCLIFLNVSQCFIFCALYW